MLASLQNLTVTPPLLRLIADLDEFKGRWLAFGRRAPEHLSSLRRVATIESIGSSTRIEGAKLTDAEVERLLAGIGRQSFGSRDEEEVAGYAAAMDLVFESWRELALTENHVQQLHGVLLRHSTRDEHHRGRYKTLPNRVEAFDAGGRSVDVILEFASPFDTPRLMQELVAGTRSALDGREHHALLVIAIFVVRVLAIHPFLDGNGRLSRILTTLLLLRAGYEYVPFSSLEKIIEDNKDGYYRALRRAQSTTAAGEGGLGEWVLFFLRCLAAQKDALAHKLEREQSTEAQGMEELSPLAAKLMQFAREHGSFTLREAVAATGGNRNTIKVHLRRLVAEGRLRPGGRGRGTWYGSS
jgi:Fic family protein